MPLTVHSLIRLRNSLPSGNIVINIDGKQENVIQNIVTAAASIRKRHCIGFIKHSIQHYQDCLNKNEIN